MCIQRKVVAVVSFTREGCDVYSTGGLIVVRSSDGRTRTETLLINYIPPVRTASSLVLRSAL